MSNPCKDSHDCSDWSDSDPSEDSGCCGPIPVSIPCGAPVVPVAGCSETGTVLEYDAETEEYVALGILYDQNCSALTDSTGSILTGAIA